MKNERNYIGKLMTNINTGDLWTVKEVKENGDIYLDIYEPIYNAEIDEYVYTEIPFTIKTTHNTFIKWIYNSTY